MKDVKELTTPSEQGWAMFAGGQTVTFLLILSLYATLSFYDNLTTAPNYIEDTSFEIAFSSLLFPMLCFCGLPLLIKRVRKNKPVKKISKTRQAEISSRWILAAIVFLVVWVVAIDITNNLVIDRYQKSPEFGHCRDNYSKHRSDYYVIDSAYCQNFGLTVVTPSSSVAPQGGI